MSRIWQVEMGVGGVEENEKAELLKNLRTEFIIAK